MNKGGFSWKRFVGISNVKRKIGRATGIPLTKGGRQQKIGRIVTGGCLTLIVNSFVMMALISIGIIAVI